jgi:hypothetical protein
MATNKPAAKPLEEYKRVKLLGQGSFGKAFLVQCKSDNVR